MSENNKNSRLIAIYGHDKISNLKNVCVAVIGLGGVGSYSACALARTGIGSLVICDFDKVEESNINRQVFANENTIGKQKCDVASVYLSEINSKLNLKTFDEKLDETNVATILKDANYIVDAIDDVQAKISIATYAQENNVPLISCMGTAMKKDSSKLKFADLYETNTCPLCKNMRKLAKEAGIKKLKVLYSDEEPQKSTNGELGSTSYLPPIAGLMIAGKVIDEL